MRFALSLFVLLVILSIFPSHADAALSGVVISEVAWMGTSESYLNEWIELYNAGNASVNLLGWTIKAEDGTPSIELSEELNAGAFLVFRRSTDYKGAMEDSGETLNLRDKSNTLIHSATWIDGSPGFKSKESRQTMELAINGSWVTSMDAGGTPGAENSVWTKVVPPPKPPKEATPPIDNPAPVNDPKPTLVPDGSNQDDTVVASAPEEDTADTDASVADEQAPIAAVSKEDAVTPQEIGDGVIISEILPNPKGKDAEEEFIELFNGGSSEVTLKGWSLMDASGKRLTLSGTISPGEYLPLFSRDISLPSLNNSGDVIELLDPNSVRRDGISYGKAKEGVSLGRNLDGVWRWTTLPTPGSKNLILFATASKNTSSLAVAPSAPEDNTPPNTKPLDINAVTGSSLGNSQLSAGLGLVSPSSKKPRGDWSLFFGFLFALAAGIVMFILKVLRRQPEPSVEFAVEESEDASLMA